MKYLIDTHLLLFAAYAPDRLSRPAVQAIGRRESIRVASVVSIWEVAIKRGLGRQDFLVDPSVFRRGLLENGYSELGIDGRHVCQVNFLPPIHKDPFDRLLVAQAQVEALTLLTMDARLAGYPGRIELV